MSPYNTADSMDEVPPQTRSTFSRTASEFREISQPVKLMVHGSTGLILDANTAAERFYGLTLTELRSRDLDSLKAAVEQDTYADRDEAEPHWLRLVYDEGRRMISRVHLSADNIPRTVDLLIHPTEVGDQPVLYITVIDTASQRMLTSAHHESQQRFRLAFEFSPIGIALVSLQGRWLQVNHHILEMLGYTEDELMSSDFQSITHPDDLEKDLELVRSLMEGETGSSYLLEKRYFHKDGSIVWALLAASVVRNSRGEPLYFVSQIENITKRKQQEAELREHQERLEMIMKAAQLGTWEAYYDTWELFVDDQWLALLGYERHEVDLTMDGLSALFHPDDMVMVREKITELYGQGIFYYQVEQRARHKNGTWRLMLSAGKVVDFDKDGNPTRLIGIMCDIHEQREAQLHENELQLERAHSRLLSNFIRDTSHDLRTPLTAISSSLYILERIDDRERRAEKIRAINFHVNYLNRVLEQLQAMATLDSGLEPNMAPVDLEVLLETLVQRYGELASNKRHIVRTHLQHRMPRVHIDGSRMYTALESIVLNALQFTPEGGAILIEAYQADGYIHINVHDNGIGIAQEHLPYVFDRFYKVDPARPLTTGGAGLGLSMAKLIVEMHQGEIEIESTEKVGTVVRIRLPIM